jgi:hypothetical protein
MASAEMIDGRRRPPEGGPWSEEDDEAGGPRSTGYDNPCEAVTWAVDTESERLIEDSAT